MRTVYLIRHGEVALPDGEKRCISATDLPLSSRGRTQGAALRRYFEMIPLSAVYHSHLIRARETAVYLPAPASTADGLKELGVGCWEGRTFREIRAAFPELYENRGRDPERYPIPGGELLRDCRERVSGTMRALLAESGGDIAVVAHAGVNRLLLCGLLGRPLREFLTIPQPYGCVNILREEAGRLTVRRIGYQPVSEPPERADGREEYKGDRFFECLYEKKNTPIPVRRHCLAVARKADQLAERLEAKGIALDREKLRMAAMLHDVARTEPDHAAAGAAWLAQLGYPDIGALIACHHWLRKEQAGRINEAAVLYLADKLVEGDREVSLKKRFSKSLEKCRTDQGVRMHERRYAQARQVERMILEAIDDPALYDTMEETYENGI